MPSPTTGWERNGLPAFHLKDHMENSNRLIGLGIIAIIVIAVLYYIWPYLVGFLAVVGGAQVYRVWRNHYGRLP